MIRKSFIIPRVKKNLLMFSFSILVIFKICIKFYFFLLLHIPVILPRVPAILSSAGLEDLVPGGNASTRSQNNGCTELEGKIITWSFEALIPVNQSEEKKNSYSTNSNYQGEIGVLLHMEARSNMSSTQWMLWAT